MSTRAVCLAGALVVITAYAEPPTAPSAIDPDPDLSVQTNDAAACYVTADTSGNDLKHKRGSKKNPYASLAEVQADLSCKNIEVGYSAFALDGGIALREGQKIRGNPGPAGAFPVVTNSSPARNGGRGVVLASKTTVSGLHIRDTYASAIFGADVDGVEIWENELSGFNASLGFSPRFLGNIRVLWSGIHIEQVASTGKSKVSIRDNRLHDALASGIVISAVGRSEFDVDMRGNTLSRLGKQSRNPDPFPPETAPRFAWLVNLGIGIYSFDDAKLKATIEGTLIEDHGPRVGLSGLCFPANPGGCLDFDGMEMFAGGRSRLDAVVDRYTYTNSFPASGGNFNSQPIQAGLESHASGATMTLEIKNSSFTDPVGSHLALTSYSGMQGASVRYIVTNNVMKGTRAPFMPAVTVQHGGFTNTGFGGAPNIATRIALDFRNNRIERVPGGSGDGLQFINYSGEISALELNIQDNEILGVGSSGRGLRFEDLDTTLASVIDAGGGALGSMGRNSIVGFAMDVGSIDYAVAAMHNWWGSANGPSNILASGTASVSWLPYLLVNPFN